MLIPRPPMGWNSWNTFGTDISDKLIRETADVMANEGFLEAGYNYLIIDDCWSMRERDENGKLVPDPEKFPNGMKAVADYVHSKGLKFGMYSCAGIRTCADYPSSFDYEYVDAQTFADWGVDYLKYDFCNFPDTADCKQRYRTMAMALKATGREILFSACNWGVENPGEWMRQIGAGMYRSTGDIFDKFESYRDIFLSQIDKLCYNAPNCFNDIDMMIVGMYGKGNVGIGGCSDTEYKTHFALWCLSGVPLIMGCDMRALNDFSKKLLLHKELIRLNQDAECRPPYLVSGLHNPGGLGENMPVFFRHLEDNEFAIGMFNFNDDDRVCSVVFADAGVPTLSGYGLDLTDIYTGEHIGIKRDYHRVLVGAHDCKLYRAKLVKL